MALETGDTDLMFPVPDKPVIDRRTLRLPPGQYIPEHHKKDLIVLHFTAGSSARSAFNSWLGDLRRVATAYIVDKDGSIFETFDPQCWAYALGIDHPKASATEKRAIQIEIANVGPLKRKGDNLYWWPKDYSTKYCGLNETAKYVQGSYRGFEYFATFTAEQESAVCSLVALLCAEFNVPPVLATGKLTVADLPFFADFKGVCAHQNFRADKFDVGPAFFWPELNDALKRVPVR